MNDLRVLMTARGIDTIAELARRSGVARSTIYAVAVWRLRPPSRHTRARLAVVLGVDDQVVRDVCGRARA